MNAAAAPDLLLVSEAEDASLRDVLARVEATGLRVVRCDNVYEAMAKLARGERFHRVLLDVRGLDHYEMAFVRLAPRYFPGLVIDSTWLNEAATPVGPDDDWRRARDLAPSADVNDEQDATEPLVHEPAALMNSRDTLSTNGLEADESSPTLHDAVRRRMASEGRATPKRRAPPAQSSSPDAAGADGEGQ